MSRGSSGSGFPTPFAVGQEGNNFATIFDAHSTSTTSHNITVDGNFVRVVAYNLSPGEVITIQQVTGSGATELAADYCPINGPLTLFFTDTLNQRTSCVLERPGVYRFVLTGGGLGLVTCRAYAFFTENEASQDIAEALFAILDQPPSPCRIGGVIPHGSAENTVVGLDDTNCLDAFQLVSSDAGNIIELHADGVYADQPDACELGAVIPSGVAVDNYIGKDGSGCLQESTLVSPDAGNQIVLHPNGLYAPAESAGILGAAPTSTTNPTIIGGILFEDVKLSGAAGNLLQINPDGLYYGILPPPSFANQYVSSSIGNDSNPGTIGSPLKTIAKALSNLPEGTTGNIFLFAGDTFPTYGPAVGEVVSGVFTFLQAINAFLNISNKVVNFYPYNDATINAINAYNTANNTGYDPYIAAEINFPVIQINAILPTDSPDYFGYSFVIGLLGALNFHGINVTMAKTGTVAPTYLRGGIIGSGSVNFEGGKLTIGNIPTLYSPGSGGGQIISESNLTVQDHGVPSTPPLFCNPNGPQYTFATSAPIAAGIPYVPTTGTHYNEDNVETFLTSAALWPGIVIYSTAFRSFKKIITSIAIA